MHCEATLLPFPICKPLKPAVFLWIVDSTQISEEDDHRYLRLLSVSELQRYKTFLRHERRRQFLLGRTLLRSAIAEITGLTTSDLVVIERPGKAPQLGLTDNRLRNLSFSLTHSRQWVACAIGIGCRLGIDIESVDPERDVRSISEIIFHPEDRRWLAQQHQNDFVVEFYRLWCKREALLKLNSGGYGREKPLTVRSGWYSYSYVKRDFATVICSSKPLKTVWQVESDAIFSSAVDHQLTLQAITCAPML